MKKILGFRFLVSDVISGVGFAPFGSGYLAWGPTARGKYFDQVIIGN